MVIVVGLPLQRQTTRTFVVGSRRRGRDDADGVDSILNSQTFEALSTPLPAIRLRQAPSADGRRGEDAPPRSRDATRPSFARNSRTFEKSRAQGMPDARCTR